MPRVKSDKCSNCKTAFRAANHRYCLACKCSYMKMWRPTHPLSDEARKRMNVRSYVKTYIKRGKVIKGVCEVCQDPITTPQHKDFDKPLEISWRCKLHKIKIPMPIVSPSYTFPKPSSSIVEHLNPTP